MRIKWGDAFKREYSKVLSIVKDPKRFNKNFWTIVNALQLERQVPKGFIINKIDCPAGWTGWYNCYIYHDRKCVIIMHYKIKGSYIYLSRIGPPSDLIELH